MAAIDTNSLHYVIRVRGKVQGVWYRKRTQDEALRIGLAGTVENMADGSVTVHAEGPPEELDQLVAWCRKGPDRAEVTSLEVETVPLQGYRGFRVLR